MAHFVRRFVTHGLLLVLVIIGSAMPAAAAKRVALVIGNGTYQYASALSNTRNDAQDMADAFDRLGFEVTRALNLGFNDLRLALRNFSEEAAGSEMAVVFYAGHGIEVNKQNYLIPVDAKLASDSAISFETIPLDLVTEAVSGASVLKLVILDACRNNPFASTMKMTSSTRSIGRGLARIEPDAGTLVAYAAKEGSVADDGDGRNSPYTAALLSYLDEPGLEINFLFRKVRDSVLSQTNGQQLPFTYGSLPARQIFLVDPDSAATHASSSSSGAPVIEAKPVETVAQPVSGYELLLQANDASGRGDLGEAVALYAAASKLGNARATALLGYAYEYGRGVKQNRNIAFDLFDQAAAAGDVQGMFSLAWAFNNGFGVSRNVERSAQLFVDVLRNGENFAFYKQVMLDAKQSLDSGTIKALQRLLSSSGHYAGAIDGQFGGGTSRALDGIGGG